MKKDMKGELGRVIKIARVANDLKTKELAEKVGFSTTYISEVESGNKSISLDSFRLLASAFNMGPSQLMSLLEKYSELGKQDIDELTRYQKTLMEALEIIINNQKDNSDKSGKRKNDITR